MSRRRTHKPFKGFDSRRFTAGDGVGLLFRRIALLLGVAALALALCGPASAMQADGCGAGECRSCHDLSQEEAKGLLKGLPVKVVDVAFSEVPGLWVVDVENRQGRKGPVYICLLYTSDAADD